MRVQLFTPDPKNRIQTILGAFTGLLSGYSHCRCRDKIKNMDFQVNFGCGGRAVAETFIFLLSRLPRVCAMCLEYNIIYLLVLCTCRCIPRSTCRFSARMCVRIFFYFLLWTPRGSPCAGRVRVGTVYFACVCAYILFYYYLFICLKERLNFRKVRDIIWSAWVEVLPPDARRNGSKISKNTPFGTH